MTRRLAVAVLFLAALAGRCRNPRRVADAPQGAIPRGKPPEYAAVAAAYNERVAPLERLWSRATVRVWYPGENEKQEQAQVDAILLFVRPDKVNLSLTHTAKTDPIAVL